MSDAPAPDPDTEIAEPDAEIVEPQDDDAGLSPELIARRDAALAHVRKWGDPVLRTAARRVDRFDDALRDEVQRLGVLMEDGLGIGLAATQVGILNRVLVYRVQHDGPIWALVNPQIEWRSGDEEVAAEGCLSLPRVQVDVERPVHVRVSAQDPDGEPILIEASGLEARVIQHEVDHLDGVLILDHAPRDQKKAAIRSLREQQSAHAVA